MKRLFHTIKALGDLAGALLLIGTLVGVFLHLLHGVWISVPDILPLISLPN